MNFDRIDWRADPDYAHWHWGLVIERADELPTALARAYALQPQFEPAQRQLSAASIDEAEVPASERQAQAILAFARNAHAR